MTWPHRSGAGSVGAVKACNTCGETKPLAEFSKRSASRDGLQPKCRSCSKQWYDEHREQQQARKVKYREAGMHTVWRQNRFERDPEGQAEGERRRYLKYMFNITPEQYDVMYADQEGHCGICGKASLGRRLAVDHDRRCCSGRRSCGDCVRGLLCGSCNPKTGFFEIYENEIQTWRNRRAASAVGA